MNPDNYNHNNFPFDLTSPGPDQKPGVVRGASPPAIKDHQPPSDNGNGDRDKLEIPRQA